MELHIEPGQLQLHFEQSHPQGDLRVWLGRGCREEIVGRLVVEAVTHLELLAVDLASELHGQ